MTRRELRDLERAAALRAEASAAPQIFMAPGVTPDVSTPVVVEPEITTPQFVAPQLIEPRTVEPTVVESQIVDVPVLLSTIVSSVSTPEVASHQAIAADKRSGKKSRSQKSFRIPRPGRSAGPHNPGRSHEPAIVQAASISAAARVNPRASHKKPFKRRMLSKLLSVSAMVGAALMIVSTSIPANAFFPTEAAMPLVATATVPMAKGSQSVQSASLATESPAVSRDGYTATSLKEKIFLRYGNRNFSYTADPNGTIRWPFPIAVPISDGYGPRVAPCPGCSTYHHGVDFTPGMGTAVGVIADGVVIGINDLDWSFGQHVLVDHVINGVHIQSLYAHMETGSIRVTMGQVLKVGDEVGQVGSTGQSTGAHLHFEIHVNGQPVDPFAWLLANAH